MVHRHLRNQSAKQGHCNDIRLILNKTIDILLYWKIALRDNAAEEVLIPMIEKNHHGEQFIEWNRCQLQVRLAFAMTINKSQSLRNVGLWLEDRTFTHGQLYVAASKVGVP